MPTGVDFSADYTIFFSCQTGFIFASFVSNRFVRNGGVQTPLSVSMALSKVPIVKIYCGICALYANFLLFLLRNIRYSLKIQ